MSSTALNWFTFILGVCWFLSYLLADRSKDELLMLVSTLLWQLWLGISMVIFLFNPIH